jgi:hypothetical protein
MNLADYLSELLGKYDEVSLPGLGYFVRTRVNGYYNDRESRFYPPSHQVNFVPELRDDDTFTQYIAEKKNISLASSKYFTEKFIVKLKEEAARGSYLFADLGIFKTDQDKLTFKPNGKIADDPFFYGYPAINLHKLKAPAKPVLTEPAQPRVIPQVIIPQQVVQPQEQPYYEEETERKRAVNIWLILLLIITVIALSLFGVYKFYPDTFNKYNPLYHKKINKKVVVAPVVKHEAKPDTFQKTAVVTDTATKVAPPVTPALDTAKLTHFEIIVAHFVNWRKAKADAQVEHYKSLGLDAKISTDAPGPLLKISVGTYFTLNEADSVRLALIKSGKINKNTKEPLEIKPKQ